MGDSQHHLYNQQMETVRSFFFSLLILGYVEDPVSGMSFQFPLGLSWIIFIEVCVQLYMWCSQRLDVTFHRMKLIYFIINRFLLWMLATLRITC